MLVLTTMLMGRVLINPGEPGEVTVSVERLMDGGVRLGFKAPRSVRIEREEVWRGQAKAPNRRDSVDAK